MSERLIGEIPPVRFKLNPICCDDAAEAAESVVS
jgi:hypothetical protein